MKPAAKIFLTKHVAHGFLAWLLVCASIANAQEIFRWVDKDGKVHYGDILPPPAEVKNVRPKSSTIA